MSQMTREVLDLVAARFDNNFGDLSVLFATAPEGAEAVALFH